MMVWAAELFEQKEPVSLLFSFLCFAGGEALGDGWAKSKLSFSSDDMELVN